MTDIGTQDAVASYLASVREALSDLPEPEVDDILDDVGPHVAEVAQELSQDDSDERELAQRLAERLGEPEQYATELRAAGGYPPRPAAQVVPKPSRALPRLALLLLAVATVLPVFAVIADGGASPVLLLFAVLFAALSLAIAARLPGGVGELATLREVRWFLARRPGEGTRSYARLLQHGWWLIRGGIAALLLMMAFGGGHVLLLMLFTIPLAIGSAWLGLRSQADRRWLWVVLPLNFFAVAIALLAIDRLDYNGPQSVGIVEEPAFRNIYPYDSTGKPLTGVYLYDEEGRPLVPQLDPFTSECAPLEEPGRPGNQYPKPMYVFDKFAGCVLLSSVPPPVTPPAPAPPSASVSPSVTPTPTPTG